MDIDRVSLATADEMRWQLELRRRNEMLPTVLSLHSDGARVDVVVKGPFGRFRLRPDALDDHRQLIRYVTARLLAAGAQRIAGVRVLPPPKVIGGLVR